MKYDDENWIKVYTRDTAGWLSLSWQARGLMLEIARRLPKHSGELSLGRKGLASLAALVRAPWSEVEPFVAELIEDGRLEYDAEAQTIRDPQHADRQNAVASGASRTKKWRDNKRDSEPPPVTPGDAGVTPRDVEQRDVTPRDQKKRREREEEKDLPSGEGLARPGLVRLDLELVDDARQVWEQRTFTKSAGKPIEDVWANFLGHFASQDFKTREALLGRWSKWINKQCDIAATERQNEYDRQARSAKINKAIEQRHEPAPAPYHKTFKPPEEERATAKEAAAALAKLTGGLFQPGKTGT